MLGLGVWFLSRDLGFGIGMIGGCMDGGFSYLQCNAFGYKIRPDQVFGLCCAGLGWLATLNR